MLNKSIVLVSLCFLVLFAQLSMAKQSSTVNTGDTIEDAEGEKYLIHQDLGEGGYSVIYEATRKSDGEKVALKFFKEPKKSYVKKYKRGFSVFEKNPNFNPIIKISTYLKKKICFITLIMNLHL